MLMHADDVQELNTNFEYIIHLIEMESNGFIIL